MYDHEIIAMDPRTILAASAAIAAIAAATLHAIGSAREDEEGECSQRDCFAQNLSPVEHELLMTLLTATAAILDEQGIQWIPVAGNLLAVYRHNTCVIPWDDDYDIAVRGADGPRAVAALRRGLARIGAVVTLAGDMGRPHWGVLHKVHFHLDRALPGMRMHKEWTWPFIDIFVGGTEDGPMGVKEITDDELPLRDVVVDGLTVHVPSRGPRSLQAFRAHPELMKTAMEGSWSHRFERSCGCTGPTTMTVPERDLAT